MVDAHRLLPCPLVSFLFVFPGLCLLPHAYSRLLLQKIAQDCNRLNTLQQTRIRRTHRLQQTAIDCNRMNTLQVCQTMNTLQTNEMPGTPILAPRQYTATQDNTLQYAATHCNTLQHTATHLQQTSGTWHTHTST